MDDYLIRSGRTEIIRKRLYARDHGRCAICCLRTGYLADLRNILHKMQEKHIGRGSVRHDRIADIYHSSARAVDMRLTSAGLRLAGRKHAWDADHVKPVCMGGGGCGLDGYRTLCLYCHKQETRRLNEARRNRAQTFTPRPPDRRAIVHRARLEAAGRRHQFPRA